MAFRKGALTVGQLQNVLMIEVGPRQVLSGLCLQNLADKQDIRYSQVMAKPGELNSEMSV